MSKKKILIIDDEEAFLKIVKLNLEESGNYEILTLSNAKNIIDEIHRFKPEVILLDILMPGISGIEACEMLNNDSFGRGVPIIILSALDRDQDKLKAYKVGVVDYLVKPIEKDQLIAKIDNALKRKSEYFQL